MPQHRTITNIWNVNAPGDEHTEIARVKAARQRLANQSTEPPRKPKKRCARDKTDVVKRNRDEDQAFQEKLKHATELAKNRPS